MLPTGYIHRIYHPLLRNLVRNIGISCGYILWTTFYILWATTEIVLPTGYKMLPTGYVCSTGYIYPVEHMTIVTYRMSPTGLKSVHRIYPQDIIFYILWVYPVDNIFYILQITYPVGNSEFYRWMNRRIRVRFVTCNFNTSKNYITTFI